MFNRTFWIGFANRLSQTKSIWQREPVTVIGYDKVFCCPDCSGICVNIDIVNRKLLNQKEVKERIGANQHDRIFAAEYVCLECDYSLACT